MSAHLRHQRRRSLQVLLIATAAAAGLLAVRPGAPATVPVLVAARDLRAGQTLRSSDVATMQWPRSLVPDGRATAAVGGVLTADVRRGEPLTNARLSAQAAETTPPPGTLAIALRL